MSSRNFGLLPSGSTLVSFMDGWRILSPLPFSLIGGKMTTAICHILKNLPIWRWLPPLRLGFANIQEASLQILSIL